MQEGETAERTALMNLYQIGELITQQAAGDALYLEFLRMPDLSMGLYVLAAGSVDPQQPHSEDEVYYVVSGVGMILVGDKDQQVRAGSIIYVEKGVDHRFHSITRDLQILVFFAPAESS